MNTLVVVLKRIGLYFTMLRWLVCGHKAVVALCDEMNELYERLCSVIHRLLLINFAGGAMTLSSFDLIADIDQWSYCLACGRSRSYAPSLSNAIIV